MKIDPSTRIWVKIFSGQNLVRAWEIESHATIPYVRDGREAAGKKGVFSSFLRIFFVWNTFQAAIKFV